MSKRNRKPRKSERPLPKTSKSRGINQELNDEERAVEKENCTNGGKNMHFRGNNDPSWYTLSPQLLSDAGQLSFNNPIGLNVDDVIGSFNQPTQYFIPGVARLTYLPSIGYSNDNSSAVNLAARRLYTYIRHANSGSANYDSPDLMLYCLAITSAYATYCMAVRAYGIANVYAQSNRYYPDGFLAACGMNSKDVRSNLANFRYGINVAAAKLNSLAVPATMSIFKRIAWLTSNIFKDAETIKSQAYVFVPSHYWVYAEGPTSTDLNQLNAIPYGWNPTAALPMGAQLTTTQLLDILNVQIQALVESEEIGIMAGDILKAYGAGNLIQVPSIAEDYVTVPNYDQEALVQINNATVLYTPSANIDNPQVTQDSQGAIIFSPGVRTTVADNDAAKAMQLWTKSKLMTLRVDSPTPADIMIASRFMASGYVQTQIAANDYSNSPTSFGTEILLGITSYSYTYTGSSNMWGLTAVELPNYSRNTWSPVLSDIYTKYDWMPLMATVTNNAINALIGDIDNYTTVQIQTLDKLHQTALLSMFNVPSLAGNFS